MYVFLLFGSFFCSVLLSTDLRVRASVCTFVHSLGSFLSIRSRVSSMPAHPSIALWSGTNKNRDISTGPLACAFARSLAPLTCLLALDCLLCSRLLLRSLVRSLAHFAHSLARGKMNDWMSQNDLVLSYSVLVCRCSSLWFKTV